jgi:hypothetical protein
MDLDVLHTDSSGNSIRRFEGICWWIVAGSLCDVRTPTHIIHFCRLFSKFSSQELDRFVH